MTDSSPTDNDFLSQVTAVIEKNIGNEQFGVSELADEMNMSRSNLLRKIKKESKLSVSQLISQVRLKKAMELLRKSSMNVSEVSHQVGFNSTSYFIKCFREYYGFPPGEVGKRDESELQPVAGAPPSGKRNLILAGSLALVIVLVVSAWFYFSSTPSDSAPLEKSIVVLPFKNDSNDSTNVYLINGLMESTLNNLQQIKDLKVISRTSAEKYRNTSRSIPEMSKELNANYFVEGSGQKIGDQILLNIQLIEGPTDKHLWAKQYRRETKDIFELQQEIARNITEEINAVITLDEQKRIEKNPTDDLVAYDLFLKGRDLLDVTNNRNLEQSISFFKKAIEKDNDFGLAYAYAAMAYYYLDIFQTEKKYGVEISSYADKAFDFDPTTSESQIAKAFVHMHKKEYEQAEPYLLKAMEYSPNSVQVIYLLADFYNYYRPNTVKYLEYALKGIRLDVASHDSTTMSYNYLQLSIALAQTGFVDEANKYMDRSLEYNPKNIFGYAGIWLRYAQNNDGQVAREQLIQTLQKDTARIDITEEVGKICYMLKDYEAANKYYRKLISMREKQGLNVYVHENLKVAFVLKKTGDEKKAGELAASFKQFADADKSIYHHLHLAGYYAYMNEPDKMIEHMQLFQKEDNFLFWVVLMSGDPIVEPFKDLPEFKKVMKEIETKFWKEHEELKVTLKEEGLL